MRNALKGRTTLLTVLAATTVIVLAGGTGAVAGSLVTSAKIKNNTIASIDVKNNALTGTDIKNSTLGGVDIADSSLGAADVKDFALTNQDVGVLFASVESTGVLENSSGNVSALRGGPGAYVVDFHRNVTKCAFTATVGSTGVGPLTGAAIVGDKDSNPNGVFVRTQDSAGVDTDRDFHLLVVC
jgi:hypothetical protein